MPVKRLMYGFVSRTSNPWKFCDFQCVYCYGRLYGQDKVLEIHASQLRRRFKATDCVMIPSLGDPYCKSAPKNINEILLKEIRNSPPSTKFLVQTKNPLGFFGTRFPSNVILGCTIESNRNYPRISKAPLQSERIKLMKKLCHEVSNDILITAEPILDFDHQPFLNAILSIGPWLFAVGYKNHFPELKLPEPRLKKTLTLIDKLKENGVKVFKKELRRAWYE